MMVLGDFVFELRSAPFQQYRRSTQQRWGANNRIGRRAAQQHIGPGDDTITLSGVLLPELTGAPSHLERVRDMADSGDSWALIDGDGYLYGKWIIESVDETRTLFFTNGQARRIEFSMSLKRVDDES